MKRNTAFTLVEMMVVMAIMVTFISASSRLFSDGLQCSRRSLKQAEINQVILIIMERWQNILNNTSPDEWKVINKKFHAEKISVYQDKRHLVFDNAGSISRFFLPSEVQCSFSVEKPSGLAPCALLSIDWELQRFHSAKTNHVRLVACEKKQ